MKLVLKLIICLLLFQNCLAQNNVDSNLNTIAESVIENIRLADKQKALLVTDRKIYSAGETVYFKAFLVDSLHDYLQTIPKKLYVDWVDEKDSVMNQLLLNNESLKTSGNFVLPDSLTEGFYWMRAYNKEMIKDNIDNIAVMPFYVVNKNKALKDANTETIIKDSSNKPILKFYPEGGSIISGLNSTIALSAKDKNGNPVIVSGVVKDNHDSVAATFSTNKYGLAKFSYFPVWFNRYTVFIKNGNNYDSLAALPPIDFFAAQLAVTQQSNDYITAQVALEDSIYSKNYTTYLIAVNSDSVCFASVGKGMYNVTIPVTKFPSGIATLYLFNDKNELLSSRSIYVAKENYPVVVHTDKQNYDARDKIKLTFAVNDANNQPEIAALSLSVADKNVADTNLNFFQTDTLQYLSQADADLIMLTQNEKTNPFYSTATNLKYRKDDTGFIVSGKIVNLQNKPVANCVFTILSNQANPIAETDTSDVNGRFKFNLAGYNDSIRFTFQVSDLRGKIMNTYHAIFDADSSISFLTPPYLKTTFPVNASFQTIKSQLAITDSTFFFAGKNWLKPVVVKGYKKPKVNYDENKRVSTFSHIITRDNIGEGPGMAGFALLRIPGVRLMNGFVIVVAPNNFTATAADEPLVVLDGVEMDPKALQNFASPIEISPVLSFLNSLPAASIDFIEVLTSADAGAYGMEGGKGVVLINTRSGSDNSLPANAYLKSFYKKGFYSDKPFEMPDYANRQIQNSKSPDLRRTIYWNGNLITDKDGKASVEFFSADAATTYIGIITGITVNGDKIYRTFTVNRN